MNGFLKYSVAAACASFALVGCNSSAPLDESVVTVSVKADSVTSDVSQLFYGLMTEEINFSYDGGLYGELIRNRGFESPEIFFRGKQRMKMPPMPQQRPGQRRPGQPGGPQGPMPQMQTKDSQGLDALPAQIEMRRRAAERQAAAQNGQPGQPGGPMPMPGNELNESQTDPNDLYVKGLYYWNAIADGNAAVSIAQDSIAQEFTVLKHNMRVDVTAADDSDRAGVYNEGYWGIPVRPSTTYKASFWAKGAEGFNQPLTVTIESNDGKTVYASAKVDDISSDWVKYEFDLSTAADAPTTADARFAVSVNGAGTFWLSFVSLFPPTYNDRPNGNRKDIMELMANMHPRFLRFPGGNYLQGNDEASRFDWKKMIGPVENRPTHYNKAWEYHSSDGMGLMEFMDWCEDLNMEPILGIFAGLYLGTAEPSPYMGEALEPYIQDALDEIEFLTGDATTKWGAVRAQYGREEPYKLRYVEVGNEDFLERGSNTYSARYKQIYDVIKKAHPELTLIASSRMVDSMTPDMADVHQYMRVANGALAEAHRYDNFDRSVPIFIGEYATREGSPTTNMRGALYDAAYLAGLERNADIIKMSCFAPIFVNVNQGGMQWPSDLMGYNAISCYGSPSYYVQGMYSKNLGTELPASSIVNSPIDEETGFEQIYYSVTKDASYIYLKVVNVSGTEQPFQTSISGVKKIAPKATVTVLKADDDLETNSIDDPTHIVPSESVEKGFGKTFATTLPAYSVTVYKLSYK